MLLSGQLIDPKLLGHGLIIGLGLDKFILIDDSVGVFFHGHVDGSHRRIAIILADGIAQATGQHALQHRLGIHGIAATDGDHQNIADQQAQHHPLLIEHFP